ncbi:hypothetical protein [Rubripirellula reticaptiva]|nr:hypothetical protein [Rubripirellula reticaptiva]
MLLPTEGHSGPAASTTVVDGAFEFATSNGPLPGTYSAVFTVKLENDEASETVFPMSKAELLAGRTDDETSEKLNSQTPTKFRTRVEISEDQSDAVQLEFEK